MDCSLPSSSVHRILQARVLEWVAIPFSRGSSRPRDWTWVSYIPGRFLAIWTLIKGALQNSLFLGSMTLHTFPPDYLVFLSWTSPHPPPRSHHSLFLPPTIRFQFLYSIAKWFFFHGPFRYCRWLECQIRLTGLSSVKLHLLFQG